MTTTKLPSGLGLNRRERFQTTMCDLSGARVVLQDHIEEAFSWQEESGLSYDALSQSFVQILVNSASLVVFTAACLDLSSLEFDEYFAEVNLACPSTFEANKTAVVLSWAVSVESCTRRFEILGRFEEKPACYAGFVL
jgi:hypothetical protein